MVRSAGVVLVVGIFMAACEKKESAPAPAPAREGKQAAVDRALGAGTSDTVMAGKGAIVGQQCALMCQGKPGIDPDACVARCTKTCADEKNTASIDSCAQRVAAESPAL